MIELDMDRVAWDDDKRPGSTHLALTGSNQTACRQKVPRHAERRAVNIVEGPPPTCAGCWAEAREALPRGAR